MAFSSLALRRARSSAASPPSFGPGRRAWALAVAAAGALCALPSIARADEPAPAKTPAWENAQPERRYGLTFGAQGGLALGKIAGFPNDSRKIGKAPYYTETGFGFGGGGTGWIGAALSDWLTFGLGMNFEQLATSGTTVRTVAFTFHVETFPAYTLGGAFRDLGVMFDAGLASATAFRGSDPSLVDSGGASRVGCGLFWEGLRWKKIAAGPFAEVDYVWSDAARRGSAMLGLRTAFYLKP